MSGHLQSVTVLGATGSIGVSTLDVISRHPDRYRVHALTGHQRVDVLAEQCARFAPRYAVVLDAARASDLRERLRARGLRTEVLAGPQALIDVCADPATDTVMSAIVGAAGLPPTLAAARAGKRILLANKESLVMAGAVFLAACDAGGATVLPIDSEHNAVFQCLPVAVHDDPARIDGQGIRRILLTASGGPFRARDLAQMRDVTPEQACAHPNWSMGRKISVDSATMMNKGLELIEASLLFRVPESRIDVVVHPQSVIHSMVEYLDGSVLAQLGNPDMRTPIAHALAYPERIASGVGALDLPTLGHLDFEQPDPDRFPSLTLAREALRAGAAAPCVLNAANEIAVDAFLNRQLAFTDIATAVAKVLDQLGAEPGPIDVDAVMALDAQARGAARAVIRALAQA